MSICFTGDGELKQYCEHTYDYEMCEEGYHGVGSDEQL